MSVSSELLCSFELLKPLDSSALKSHIKKGRSKRQQMLNSPVSELLNRQVDMLANDRAACECYATECLTARGLRGCVRGPFLLFLYSPLSASPLLRVSVSFSHGGKKQVGKRESLGIASRRRHPSLYPISRGATCPCDQGWRDNTADVAAASHGVTTVSGSRFDWLHQSSKTSLSEPRPGTVSWHCAFVMGLILFGLGGIPHIISYLFLFYSCFSCLDYQHKSAHGRGIMNGLMYESCQRGRPGGLR